MKGTKNMNILHPIQSLEKWALQRLLKRAVEEIPVAEEKLAEVWKAHEDEIYKKVGDAVKDTVVSIIKKALERKDNKGADTSEN